MIDLCVINYNTVDKLERLIRSLEVGPNNFALYIADNGSTDGSVEFLKDLHANYIVDTVFNENIGYSAACNQLAAMGKSNILALLNADVWMTGHDVSVIEKNIWSDPDIHILGPKQRDEQGRITHAGIFGPNNSPKHRGWKQQDPMDQLFRDVLPATTVSGAAYFIRRNVWESLTQDPDYQRVAPGATGAFLPTPHYFEETWCSYFARHKGYNVVYDGRVSIGHSWHASSEVGGEADQKFRISQQIFREACDKLGIEHD